VGDGEPRGRLIKKFVERLKSENIFHVLDITGGKSYKQYEVADRRYLENILVKQGNEHIRLHASKIIKSLPSQATRLYFSDFENREKAKNILKSLE
jgi:hypothetical protein